MTINQKNTKKARRNDVILISTVLLVAIFGLLLVFLFRKEGAYAVIEQNGKILGRYPLDQSAEIPIASGDHYNFVVIEGGKVHIADANCPDRLCVGMRAASYRGETLVCLPHGVIVTVYGGDDQVDIVV